MLYLDTSALLKLYIRESGSEQVQALIESQEEPLPIWEMQSFELINALRLKVFWGEITTLQADAQIALFDQRRKRGLYYFPDLHRSNLMLEYRKLSELTPDLGCRTMDVLHVACALQLEVDDFVSFDDRQRTLAQRAGLRVNP